MNRHAIDVAIVGAGGFGREVLQYVRDIERESTSLRPVCFLDDKIPAGSEIDGLPVSGAVEWTNKSGYKCVIGVGDVGARLDLIDRLRRAGAAFVSVVHPLAYVGATARVGTGNVLCPFAFVGPGARLGDHVAVNVGACVGHDAAIGEGSIISPNATVCGNANLGRGVMIGAGATVAPGVQVGKRSQIGAGSVVYREVSPGSLAIGNPAKSRVVYPQD